MLETRGSQSRALGNNDGCVRTEEKIDVEITLVVD
jgi:hypothetical protein